MREIIYIQAGNTSNHVGTHFWNTQESYFTYDEDSEPIVNHDISFREGLSNQNEPTFCPRALIFDYKSNFGPLSKHNELYPDIFDADQPHRKGLWNGAVSEYRQEVISKSDYRKRLESEDDNDDNDDDLDVSVASSKMRYWSDFNRVYYHPRSIQQLSDLPDWQANKGDWNYGRDIFRRFDLENSLSEDSLRSLLEESNNAQGFQMTFDNPSFGGFSIGLLEAMRDEQPKIPVLTFPLLSGVDAFTADPEDASLRKSVLQDAVCICSLDELGTQSLPIHMPTSWQLGKWSEQLSFDRNNLYQSTAILSTHIESSMLPLRLKSTHEDLSDFCNHLNWSQNTRFSHLSGVLPFRDGIDLDEAMYDFSAGRKHTNRKHTNQYLVQRNVSRGLTIGQARSIDTYFTSSTGLEEPYLSSIHAPAYPLPSSFPNIVLPRSAQSNNSNLPSSTNKRERNIPLISSLHTATSTAAVLRGYAALCRACVVRRYSGADAAGLEAGEVREIVEKLEAIAESYAAQKHEESEEGDDDLGEDGAIE